jgi:hypothetical protein
MRSVFPIKHVQHREIGSTCQSLSGTFCKALAGKEKKNTVAEPVGWHLLPTYLPE